MEISFLVISSGFSNWSRIWEESWPWPQTCYLQQSKRLFFQGCRRCYLELMWVSLAWVCERWGLLGRPAPLWAVWCAWHLLWEALMGTRNKNTSLLIVRMLFHNIWRYPYRISLCFSCLVPLEVSSDTYTNTEGLVSLQFRKQRPSQGWGSLMGALVYLTKAFQRSETEEVTGRNEREQFFS